MVVPFRGGFLLGVFRTFPPGNPAREGPETSGEPAGTGNAVADEVVPEDSISGQGQKQAAENRRPGLDYGFSVAFGIIILFFIVVFFVPFFTLAHLFQHVPERGIFPLGGEAAGEEAQEKAGHGRERGFAADSQV